MKKPQKLEDGLEVWWKSTLYTLKSELPYFVPIVTILFDMKTSHICGERRSRGEGFADFVRVQVGLDHLRIMALLGQPGWE